jgi:hypothetical protein
VCPVWPLSASLSSSLWLALSCISSGLTCGIWAADSAVERAALQSEAREAAEEQLLQLCIGQEVGLAETARGVERIGEVCERVLQTVAALAVLVQSTRAAHEREQHAWRQERAQLEWRECEREAQHNEVRDGVSKRLEIVGEDVEDMLRLVLEVDHGFRADTEEQALLVKHLRDTIAELQAGKQEAELKVQVQRRKAAQVIEQLRQDLILAQEQHALEVQGHDASAFDSSSPSHEGVQDKPRQPLTRGRVGRNRVVKESSSSSSTPLSRSPRGKLPGQITQRDIADAANDDRHTSSDESSSPSPAEARRRRRQGKTGRGVGKGREGNDRGPGRWEDGEREALLESLRKSRLLLAENERLLESACLYALSLL